MAQNEALQLAVTFLARSQRDDEPLAIDTERVRESNGLLIAPYNSVQYLGSRDAREQLLDCWPILVDLERGDVRFGTLDERHLWRNPSTLWMSRSHSYGTALRGGDVRLRRMCQMRTWGQSRSDTWRSNA